ncbi:MAG: hypothetical protein KAH23_01225 [Kiritimatiellae bacterium]|nr:hypothetical protein [Kiritimatiellia bacterium]
MRNKNVFTTAGMLICTILISGGCQTAKVAELTRYLLDDFERDELWTLDSANNYGQVHYSSKQVSRGRNAMQLTFFDNGKGKTMFRREVSYDLSETTMMWIDVFNPNKGDNMQIALAFTNKERQFFETTSVNLGPGWNRNLPFDISDSGMKEGTDLSAWLAQRHKTTRIMMLVSPGENKKGVLSVDNLRIDRPGVNRNVWPHLIAASKPPKTLYRHEPHELVLRFTEESLRDDATEKPGTLIPLKIQARMTKPSGKKLIINGFLKAHKKGLDGNITYAVRFAPDSPGQWGIDFGYVAEHKWQSISTEGFFCKKTIAMRGKPRIDPVDPRFFSLQDNTFFYPLGQNVCWAADYEPYMKAMNNYGGNFMRIWICPWNNPLLMSDDVNKINLESADKIDDIFMLAQKYGIYIQLVLTYHDAVGKNWDRSPFSKKNGGPCVLPQDFWINKEARKAFKKKIDYVIKRWSYHPNLFAIELVNEIDHSFRYKDKDVITWHREMGDYLKQIDPHNNMLTTSAVSHKGLAEIWKQPAIDFVTSHFYNRKLAEELNRQYIQHKIYNKPYFIGETGLSWQAAGDQTDRDGQHLHHSLWLAWMTPTSGNALPWWWDTHIEPNKLQYHFSAAAAYSKGEDRRGKKYRKFTESFGTESTTRLQGMANRISVYGFVYDSESIARPDIKPTQPIFARKRQINIRGMLDGEYTLQIWDTYKGLIVTQTIIKCENGTLEIPFSITKEDFAFKAKFNGNAAVTTSVR